MRYSYAPRVVYPRVEFAKQTSLDSLAILGGRRNDLNRGVAMCSNEERCGECDGLAEPIPAECREPCMDLVPMRETPEPVLDRAMTDQTLKEVRDAQISR